MTSKARSYVLQVIYEQALVLKMCSINKLFNVYEYKKYFTTIHRLRPEIFTSRMINTEYYYN